MGPGARRARTRRRGRSTTASEGKTAVETATSPPVREDEPPPYLPDELPSIDDLLLTLVRADGSDLHLRVDEPPVIRVYGQLQRLPYRKLTAEDTERLMFGLMDTGRQRRFKEDLEMDLSYELPGIARFRVNVFQQRGRVGGVMRLIPAQSKTIDDLGLPAILKHLSMLPRGLVLVTGPTGSGKTTTLAACIDHINRNRRCHIITIEDPIEFVHTDNAAAIEQRELGQDTHSFAQALKHIMRQAPDVILVGEMRDLETISLAITAAETGHLVFATLHTTDAPQTIDRIIDVFPSEQQDQIRTQLAVTLQAVVSQTLLPLAEGGGRVPAFEIMIATPAIRALIREAKTHQIYSMIETGADSGMISLDQYLLHLLKDKTITLEQALVKSSNPAQLEQRYQRADVGHFAAGHDLSYGHQPVAAPRETPGANGSNGGNGSNGSSAAAAA